MKLRARYDYYCKEVCVLAETSVLYTVWGWSIRAWSLSGWCYCPLRWLEGEGSSVRTHCMQFAKLRLANWNCPISRVYAANYIATWLVCTAARGIDLCGVAGCMAVHNVALKRSMLHDEPVCTVRTVTLCLHACIQCVILHSSVCCLCPWILKSWHVATACSMECR